MASDGPPEKKRKRSDTSGEPSVDPRLQQNDFIWYLFTYSGRAGQYEIKFYIGKLVLEGISCKYKG